MNDWYKNGELPPVGIVVEVLGGAYGSDDMVWRKSEIYAHVKGEVLAESTSHSGVYKLYSANECRPPRTETDKLLEQMERSFESTGCVFTSDHYALAEHLIEQGYRKIKQMTEDEFVLDLSNRFETYSEMYQAGCRFIEQGE